MLTRMKKKHPLKWWCKMKMMRNLMYAIGLQLAVALLALWSINTHSIIYEAVTFGQISLMILALFVTVLVLMYVIWFDRNLMDVLIDREAELRSDVFNQEEEIRNHEIFRDINMIKVLAQNNEAEALKTYVMEELDGY